MLDLWPTAVLHKFIRLHEQLRGQRHFIGRDIPELQLLKCFQIPCLHGNPVGCASAQFFAWCVVDVVNRLADIPLSEVFQYGPFGDDHPEHCMDLFNAGFLAAPHGVTVVNACSGTAAFVILERPGVTKLASPVRQHHGEDKRELIRTAQSLLDLVEFGFHGTLCAAVHQLADKKFHVREIQRQDAFGRAFGRQDGIHLDIVQFIAMLFFEIPIGFAFKHGPVGYGCYSLFPWFEFHLALKVDVPAEKNPWVNVVVERFYRDP